MPGVVFGSLCIISTILISTFSTIYGDFSNSKQYNCTVGGPSISNSGVLVYIVILSENRQKEYPCNKDIGLCDFLKENHNVTYNITCRYYWDEVNILSDDGEVGRVCTAIIASSSFVGFF